MGIVVRREEEEAPRRPPHVFYLGQPWRDILTRLPGAIPCRLDFEDMPAEDKHFFSTLLGVLQDCARYNLYDDKQWQDIGQRLFGLCQLAGSFKDQPFYRALDQRTFPSVAGWVYVAGAQREDRLLTYLRALAPLLIEDEPKPQRFIQNVGRLLALV